MVVPRDFTFSNYADEEGNPRGGKVEGKGIDVRWQDGPVREAGTNGAQVEQLIQACILRLEYYQTAADGKFNCFENAMALTKLNEALAWLDRRTALRKERGVEGTNTA